MNADYFDQLIGDLLKTYTNTTTTERKAGLLITLFGLIKAKAMMYMTQWKSFLKLEVNNKLKQVTGMSDKLIFQSKTNTQILDETVKELDKSIKEVLEIREEYDLRLVDKALNPDTRGKVLRTIASEINEIESSIEYEPNPEKRKQLMSRLEKLKEMSSTSYYRSIIIRLDNLFIKALELWGVVCKTSNIS